MTTAKAPPVHHGCTGRDDEAPMLDRLAQRMCGSADYIPYRVLRIGRFLPGDPFVEDQHARVAVLARRTDRTTQHVYVVGRARFVDLGPSDKWRWVLDVTTRETTSWYYALAWLAAE